MSDEWIILNADTVHESAKSIRQTAGYLWEAAIPEYGDPSRLGPEMRAHGEGMVTLLGRSADAVAGGQSSFGAALLAAVAEYVTTDEGIGATVAMSETE